MSSWSFDKVERVQIQGRFWRMLSPRWQHDPLSGAGAARSGGRWNPAGTPALYLSDAHATAIAEYMQALVHPGTLTPYDVASDMILDLTDPALCKPTGVDDALLTLDWRHMRDVSKVRPTSWDFAEAAIAAGFDGLRVHSTQTQGSNLVLWRWRGEGAKVELVDPTGLLG